jgi:hypothetical protein
VDNARQMALGKNTLFVGSRRAGKVYAIPLQGNRTPVVIADGLNMPVGVAFRDGDLYVSAVSRVLRLRDIEARLAKPPRPETVSEAWPTETHHGWKFIAFGPDGKLYVPVGAPCNICDAGVDRYATITRLDVGSGKLEVVARGVRNTVGFDWHPASGELWFTDNGRDMMGDDVPPDELNRLAKIGQHFGYPHCHGRAIADPEFGRGRRCADFRAAGAGTRRARGGARHALLHRQGLPRALPQRRLHCRARLVEPQQQGRLSRQRGAPGRQPRGELRALRQRLDAG